jgi:leucyl-tRNA synthetase
MGQRALRWAVQCTVSLLFPFSPHISSELWAWLGGERLWQEPWPEAADEFLERETVTVVVQVNGKRRDAMDVPPGATDDEVVAAARLLPKVASAIDGKTPVKEIVVPDRLVNLVVR